MPKIGIICILLLGMLGCTHTQVLPPEQECPLRPVLEPITIEQQMRIDSQVILIIATNELKLKQHILRLEARAGCRSSE